MLNSPVVVFLGAPGSGKGTQSAWLSRELGIPALSTGEALRAEARRTTASGVELRRILASGSLVSDEVVCEAVGARLRAEAAQSGMILDGFPRTVAQAKYLDGLLTEIGLPKPVVIHLHVPEHKLLRRLTGRRACAVCGSVYNLNSHPSLRGHRCENDGGLLIERDDDREEVVLRRLADFEASLTPIIDYFDQQSRRSYFHIVDGDRDLDVVAAELVSIAAPSVKTVAA